MRGLQYSRDDTFTEIPEFENHITNMVYEDREKSIWVSTAANGLKRYKTTAIDVIGQPEGKFLIHLSRFQKLEKHRSLNAAIIEIPVFKGYKSRGEKQVPEEENTMSLFVF